MRQLSDGEVLVLVRECHGAIAGRRPDGAARHAFRADALARLLGTTPGGVVLRRDVAGGICPVPDKGGAVYVSPSSSSGVVGLAVARGTPVGFDIEHHAVGLVDDLMADEVLTATERVMFRASCDPIRCFFELWCCKEAVLKACGAGLRRRPREVEVTSGENGGWASARGPDGAAWSVLVVQLPWGGMSAAVCVEQPRSVRIELVLQGDLRAV